MLQAKKQLQQQFQRFSVSKHVIKKAIKYILINIKNANSVHETRKKQARQD